MNVIVVDFDPKDGKVKKRWKRFKAEIRKKIDQMKDWCSEHTDVLIKVVPVVIAGLGGVVKMLHRKTVVDRKEKLMKYSVYDRSENHHWFLKRELTNREWSEIADRRGKGERLGDILEKMKVLK